MPNPYQEPIEEKDINLEGKFTVGKEKPELAISKEAEISKTEKETAKEISGAEKDVAYGKILSKVQSQPQPIASDDDVKKDAHTASQKTDAESQIQHLVDVAMQKGVAHAVKVARHMEDNYVLDMFHDKLLADELHDALLKKGLIKDI
ncbi:MAG: hypothetical protein A3J63_04150 [Candidatus Moranbacteria bacterium RIFCSPHIGHO2_02_FULL_40_12b]|nr:MAG: hypothetical protein A3J63_04150 [Candidatus Moranbacteria bacterium RIFCSPHIGHO2_02_FULL_40_12b]OGI24293.1 MAG: hypothetical protein A3E91_01060 [Candidatus Moranbacteria bacterium RIFCSPHIGHO2_12_FULL_40_10]